MLIELLRMALDDGITFGLICEEPSEEVSKQTSEEVSKEASEEVGEEVGEGVGEEASKERSAPGCCSSWPPRPRGTAR